MVVGGSFKTHVYSLSKYIPYNGWITDLFLQKKRKKELLKLVQQEQEKAREDGEGPVTLESRAESRLSFKTCLP